MAASSNGCANEWQEPARIAARMVVRVNLGKISSNQASTLQLTRKHQTDGHTAQAVLDHGQSRLYTLTTECHSNQLDEYCLKRLRYGY